MLDRRRPMLWLLAVLVTANLSLVALAPDVRTEVLRFFESWVLPPRPGFSVRSAVDPFCESRKYVLYVPEQPPPQDGYPLILYLNGYGEDGDDAVSPLRNALAPAVWDRQHEFPFLVIFAQCPKGESWVGAAKAAQQAFAILDEVERVFRVDPERICLTGISSGGSGVWAVAALRPERFAAAVPVSAGGADAASVQAIVAAGLPVWSFHLRDDVQVADGNRRTRQALVDAGSSPRFSEIDGARDKHSDGHNAWDFAFRNPILYDWLLRQRRSTNADHARQFQRIFDRRDPAGFHCSDAPAWVMNDERELCCLGGHGADAWIETAATLTDFELHFEFQHDSAAHWFLETSGMLFAFRSADAGSCELLKLADRQWLADGDPVAQRTFRPGAWNDIRVTARSGNLSIELNGWPLLSVSRSAKAGSCIRLAVPAANETPIVWRDARIRESIASGEGAHGR